MSLSQQLVTCNSIRHGGLNHHICGPHDFAVLSNFDLQHPTWASQVLPHVGSDRAWCFVKAWTAEGKKEKATRHLQACYLVILNLIIILFKLKANSNSLSSIFVVRSMCQTFLVYGIYKTKFESLPDLIKGRQDSFLSLP